MASASHGAGALWSRRRRRRTFEPEQEEPSIVAEVNGSEGMTMIIIALAAALMLDASPKLETVAKLTAREAPAQENYAAPILAVAVTLECTARATGQVENCR